jgi:hypothetical protein
VEKGKERFACLDEHYRAWRARTSDAHRRQFRALDACRCQLGDVIAKLE